MTNFTKVEIPLHGLRKGDKELGLGAAESKNGLFLRGGEFSKREGFSLQSNFQYIMDCPVTSVPLGEPYQVGSNIGLVDFKHSVQYRQTASGTFEPIGYDDTSLAPYFYIANNYPYFLGRIDLTPEENSSGYGNLTVPAGYSPKSFVHNGKILSLRYSGIAVAFGAPLVQIVLQVEDDSLSVKDGITFATTPKLDDIRNAWGFSYNTTFYLFGFLTESSQLKLVAHRATVPWEYDFVSTNVVSVKKTVDQSPGVTGNYFLVACQDGNSDVHILHNYHDGTNDVLELQFYDVSANTFSATKTRQIITDADSTYYANATDYRSTAVFMVGDYVCVAYVVVSSSLHQLKVVAMNNDATYTIVDTAVVKTALQSSTKCGRLNFLSIENYKYKFSDTPTDCGFLQFGWEDSTNHLYNQTFVFKIAISGGSLVVTGLHGADFLSVTPSLLNAQPSFMPVNVNGQPLFFCERQNLDSVVCDIFSYYPLRDVIPETGAVSLLSDFEIINTFSGHLAFINNKIVGRGTQIRVVDGVNVTNSIRTYSLSIDTASKAQRANYGTSSYMGGGQLLYTDESGVIQPQIIEHPVAPYGTSTSTTGGTIPDGAIVNLKYVWEITTPTGVSWESRDSSSIAVTAPSSSNQNQVGLKLYRPCFKLPSNYTLRIKMYATTGTVFRLAATKDLSPVQVIPITDTVLVTALPDASAEPLYTTTEPPNDPVPRPISFVSGLNRDFAATTRKIYYAKPRRNDRLQEFSLLQTITPPRSAGNIRSLGVLDDKLIVFCENDILFLAGLGPDATGAGGFTPLTPIPTAEPIKDDLSVIEIASGLLYSSESGISLIARDLSTRTFTQETFEFLNDVSVLGTVFHNKRKTAYFLLNNNSILSVCETTLQFTHIPLAMQGTAIESIGLYNDQIMLSSSVEQFSGGSVRSLFLETSIGVDGSTNYEYLYDTGWIPMDGPQGYVNVRSIQLLAKLGADAATQPGEVITCKIYYDYDNTTAETHTEALGAHQHVFQWSIKPQKNKMQSIRIIISESSGYDLIHLNAITLEAMPKGGLQRLEAGRKS